MGHTTGLFVCAAPLIQLLLPADRPMYGKSNMFVQCLPKIYVLATDFVVSVHALFKWNCNVQ